MIDVKSAVFGSVVLIGLNIGVPALAFGYADFTEDRVTGWIGPIPTSDPAIIVASDGEVAFDPFGAGFDISDGIQLNANWAPDPAYAAAFAPGYWTQLPGTFTWVLPACNSTGCENANIFEPIAKWIYTPGGGWAPGTLGLRLWDPDGIRSDLITVANDGPGGAATITFDSNVPEPASWALLVIGFAAVGYTSRRTRARIAAVTA